MEILKNVVLALHIIGIAALLGGALFQMKAIRAGQARVLPAMLHGAWTMLVTGVALVALQYPLGHEPNNIKISVKLAILIAILVISLVYRKREVAPTWVVPVVGGLTVVNVVLATVWR